VPVIEVYADIWCPFTHVGLRTVARRRKLLERDDVTIRVRAWPLELVNGAPLDPAVTEEHVNALREQVAPDLFTHFDAEHFPRTTLPALALAVAAYGRGDRIGEAISFALRDALFEEGQDISCADVLGGLATSHGLGATGPREDNAVLAEWHDGQSRGVEGSPHFFCGEVESFCPSLDISRDHGGHLLLRRDTKALDAFLAQCFEV
jgi:predicted DsbA family dithiol-disulfide isomerase